MLGVRVRCSVTLYLALVDRGDSNVGVVGRLCRQHEGASVTAHVVRDGDDAAISQTGHSRAQRRNTCQRRGRLIDVSDLADPSLSSLAMAAAHLPPLLAKLSPNARRSLVVVALSLLITRGRLFSFLASLPRSTSRQQLSREELAQALQQLYVDEPDGAKTILVPFRGAISKVRSVRAACGVGQGGRLASTSW